MYSCSLACHPWRKVVSGQRIGKASCRTPSFKAYANPQQQADAARLSQAQDRVNQAQFYAIKNVSQQIDVLQQLELDTYTKMEAALRAAGQTEKADELAACFAQIQAEQRAAEEKKQREVQALADGFRADAMSATTL